MPRFFAEMIDFPSAAIEDASSVRHITGSLRRRRGDEVAGRVGTRGYRARITSIHAGKIMLEIIAEDVLRDRCSRTVHLGLSLVDLKDFEDVLRPVTELGVADIHPVISQRSSVRSVTAARFTRWQSIIMEAVKQCERKTIPVIHEPADLPTLVRARFQAWGRKLFAHCDGERTLAAGDDRDVGIIIGPEGGFTDQEVLLMESEGFAAAGMGLTTLRTVTAAIAAVGILGLEARKI